MITQTRSLSHRRRLLSPSYHKQLLKLVPIAYWPFWEASGASAECLVNASQAATVTGVTWANDNTGPFKTPAPFFDGANDYGSGDSAALFAAFNGATGSAAVWAKMASGAWTDGQMHYLLLLSMAWSERLTIAKISSNTISSYSALGGGSCNLSKAGLSTTGWFHVAITWSDGNNDDKAFLYINGTPTAAACTTLNNWTGAPLDGVRIGYGNSPPPSQKWYGWMAQLALWDRVLSQAEVNALANP